MNPTVTIHSDADGVTRTITLTKTGANTGHITMASTAAPASDQNYAVTDVQADSAALKLACRAEVLLFSVDIDLSIQKGNGGKTPIATVVVSASGTYDYPLRAGEDHLVQNFLVQAAFPQLGAAPAIAAKGTRAKSPPPPKPAAIAPPPPAARPFKATDASLYGQFVQAAYTMYSQNLRKLTALTPPPSSDFPPGYRLVAWVQMQDFILQSTAPTFYGIIAQSNAGPGQFVVAIRGTSNGVEWWDDANAVQKTPFKNLGCGSVGMGFARIYDTLEVVDCEPPMPGAAPGQSLKAAGTFARQISALVRRHTPATAVPGGIPTSASVEVAGHSLGAALATLYAMENAKTEQLANPALCTFASPLVGDATFAAAFNALGLTSWRIDNAPDLVTKIPPAILGFVHVDTEVPVNSAGKVMPFVTCWHSLATYLSLIDPTKQPEPGCRLWAAAQPVSVAPPVPAAASLNF